MPTTTQVVKAKKVSQFLFLQPGGGQLIPVTSLLGDMACALTRNPELKLQDGEEKRVMVTVTMEVLGS